MVVQTKSVVPNPLQDCEVWRHEKTCKGNGPAQSCEVDGGRLQSTCAVPQDDVYFMSHHSLYHDYLDGSVSRALPRYLGYETTQLHQKSCLYRDQVRQPHRGLPRSRNQRGVALAKAVRGLTQSCQVSKRAHARVTVIQPRAELEAITPWLFTLGDCRTC